MLDVVVQSLLMGVVVNTFLSVCFIGEERSVI